MKERLIGHRVERVLKGGGAVLGLVAFFSLGCEQKPTTVVGPNGLISVSSSCEGSESVVDVKVKIPKPVQGSEMNLLVIRKGSTNSRVLV